ncbi:MAG TPA: carboxypeptidase-like regulatory domain-containing protein [Edaphobacter sp.]|nr:carboxypeptidase-like regulatory domain-containing protein [Edaphobacter sp.]
MIHRSKLWFLTIVMMMFSELLYAQNTSGTITGRVTDTTGATISGARVSIINIGSGDKRDITTDASGNFTATLLLPGSYNVTAEKEGFKTQVRTGITLQVDQTVRVDSSLEVGSTSERVEVTANALTLDTDSSTIGTVVDRRQVSELPLNGRSFVNLLFLEPGAVQTGGEQSSFRYGVGDAISIGGGVSASNSFTLDGTTITDTSYVTPAFTISVEAIQEFKAQTKNYTAEFGFGANQVNLSTRSGTNQFHGSVFESSATPPSTRAIGSTKFRSPARL